MNNIDLSVINMHASISLQCQFDVPYLIVVSSVRYSYVDIRYSILAIISRIISFPQFLRCL